jgi:hypothetical protein
VVAGRWRGGREALPGFEEDTWLAGGLVALVAVVVAVAAEEEDAGNEDEGAEDGGEDGCVRV